MKTTLLIALKEPLLLAALTIIGLVSASGTAAPATLTEAVADAHKCSDHPACQTAFAAYLALLSQQPVPIGPGPYELRLQELAAQHAAAPERVQELLTGYGRWHDDGFGTPIIKLPDRLDPRHVAEEYRPAWEVLLLAPPGAEIRFMGQRELVTEALAGIHNPESIPILELGFQSASAEGVDQTPGSVALDRQLQIIEALSQFPSQAGLQALVNTLAEAANVNKAARTNKIDGKTLQQWAVSYLSEGNSSQRQKWRSALDAFPRQGLKESQTRVLDALRAQERERQ